MTALSKASTTAPAPKATAPVPEATPTTTTAPAASSSNAPAANPAAAVSMHLAAAPHLQPKLSQPQPCAPKSDSMQMPIPTIVQGTTVPQNIKPRLTNLSQAENVNGESGNMSVLPYLPKADSF